MSRIKVLETFVVLGLAAVVFYLVTGYEWLVWMAGAILLVVVFDNPLAKFIAKWWLRLSELLGKVMSRVMLTLVFYVFLVPTAFLYRRFNGEAVAHFKNMSGNSFFTDIKAMNTRESYENPW